MARLPRPDLANVAQHIVQRGNNRLPCFIDDEDRRRYLAALRENSLRYGCVVHAYVLMTNHVHMLMTQTKVGAAARFLQQLGRSYVSQFNARHRRTGTLWEGRYKSCLVEGGRYVLACYRYIELNPVRARMVAKPDEHAWSSYGANAWGRADSIVTPHSCYLALGAPGDRFEAYRRLVADVLDVETVEEIRKYLQQQRAFGNDRFQATVEAELGRFAAVRPAHRPKRPGDEGKVL